MRKNKDIQFFVIWKCILWSQILKLHLRKLQNQYNLGSRVFFIFRCCHCLSNLKKQSTQRTWLKVHWEQTGVIWNLFPRVYCFSDRVHPFSMYAKFSEKLTFLTSWYAHICVRSRGLKILVLQKIVRTYLNGWSHIGQRVCHPDINSYILRHCMKSVQIRDFSGPFFLTFGLNTERYSVSLHIQSQCGKIRIRKNSVFGHFSRSAR